jgi:hypothetical protein
LLNEFETDEIGTIRSNREKTYKRHQGKKIKARRMAVSFRRKMMTLNWNDERDVSMLSSMYNEEMQAACDKKGGEKQKPKVCTEYNNAMELLTFLIITLQHTL